MTNITLYLNLAKQAYQIGNPAKAITYTEPIITFYKNNNCSSHSFQESMDFLDALTLHQTLLAVFYRMDEYLSLESDIKQLIFLLFSSKSSFYYALHLFDVCGQLARNHFLIEARFYRNMALNLLQEQLGVCPYFSFMTAVCDAQIAFYMEDYYTCIDTASKANALWYTPEYGQVFPPDLERTPQAMQSIDHIGINNMLLLCNAYGKINNPKESITALENTLGCGAFDYYQTISAKITLAELYVLDGQMQKALEIYETYKNTDLVKYPDFASALASLSFVLEHDSLDFTNTLMQQNYCCGHDAFITLRYNYALSLVSSEKYQEALEHFQAIGEKGYSMSLSIFAMYHQINDIIQLQEKAAAYFYRQIEQIISHYNEKLAYNHLAKLQYHIDLCLGAYCSCISSNQEPCNHACNLTSIAYDFLLNTKYITLETSILLQAAKKQKSRTLYHTKQVMEHLPKDTLLLEFTQTRSIDMFSYGVFLISSENIHYLLLDTTDIIDQYLEDWHTLLQQSVDCTEESYHHILQKQQRIDAKLRKSVFLPIKPYLANYSKLLIAPAGAFVNFPFSRLSLSAKTYLGDCYPISYINTGKELCVSSFWTTTHSFLADISRPIIPKSQTSAIIIGNPTVHDYPNLPFAETEADMAAYFLQSTCYKKENATRSLLLNATNPVLIHIAAHGIIDTSQSQQPDDWDTVYQYMTNSGIIFANDKLLSCAQISTLNLSKTKLAVLSCCHSAHANYSSSEGAYGLRRAFHLAGCKAVIANLWQADDTISFLFMKHFYEALTIGSDSVEDSFTYAIDAIRKQEPNPYYWAGFVLIH